MRVFKQLWEVVPLPKNLRLMWDRITFSKLTTIYFFFSLCHSIAQISLRSQAFLSNAVATDFLSSIHDQSSLNSTGFPVLGNDLRICEEVPTKNSAEGCKVVWTGKQSSDANTGDTYNAIVASSSAKTQAQNYAPSSVLATSKTTSISVIATSTATPASTTVTSASTTSTSKSSVVAVAVTTSASITTPLRTTTVVRTIETIIIRPGVNRGASVEKDDDDDDDDDDNESRSALAARSVKIMAILGPDGNWTVQLNGLGYNNASTRLSSTCLTALEWPIVRLSNTKREDVVFISFNIWVLGMSIVALLNESIPHIIASLLTHVLATVWAAFQIGHTKDFRSSFQRLITQGACSSSLPLLPNYWQQRGNAELASLILNAVALLASSFLTWRLVKLFGWQTFKRVGASVKINRIYKLVLTFSITIQLSLFFMLVSLGLWLDQLYNGAIGRLALRIQLYQALTFITIILTLPWLATGWIASRKELRLPMYIFLGMSVSYLATWAAMFMSNTFRWTFMQWTFFGIMNSAGVALTFLSFVLGVISRCNFGQGLSRHLEAAETLPGNDFETAYPKDLEKVDFPSNDGPVPTFSVAFGSGNEVPPPSQMFVGSRGPRFNSPSSEPFETPRESAAGSDHSRVPSYDSLGSGLVRSGSQQSASSSFTDDKHLRWVIE